MGKLLKTVLVLTLILFVGAQLHQVQAQAAWAPNTAYAVNTQVTYGGHIYKCLQAHTSQVGWEPPNVPALWQDLGAGGGSTPVPATKTNTPVGATAVPPKTNTPSSTGTCLAAYVNTQVYVAGDTTS